MKQSTIGWCDFSGGNLNFVTGCTPVSAGCKNCYARAIYERYGKDFSEVTAHPNKLELLIHTNFTLPLGAYYKGDRSRPLCFVCDTGDLFHPDVPADFITHSFEVMSHRKDIDWAVLTKRPKRMAEVLFGEEGCWYLGGGDYWENIWIGVTAENQAMADERIPILLNTWCGTKFVSVEPMLSAVNLNTYLQPMPYRKPLSWVICGAESGANRRLFNPDWAEQLFKQCREADVPYFYKQDSAFHPGQKDELSFYGEIKEWPGERP